MLGRCDTESSLWRGRAYRRVAVKASDQSKVRADLRTLSHRIKPHLAIKVHSGAPDILDFFGDGAESKSDP